MEPKSWPGVLETLLVPEDLTIGQAEWAMDQVVSGLADPAQLGAFLVALRAKRESVDELVGFRDAILAHAVPLAGDSLVLDIVGTGGDRHGTVNVSTMASIVCAAAGVPVLKHGNRAVSSRTGASDVLGELGVIPADEDPQVVRAILDEAGISFAWAMRFHPGFRHAGPVRAALGVSTVFNQLGPLVHPARPEVTACGVADRSRIQNFVGVYATRGGTAFVFRGEDGLDELTTTGHSELWEVVRGDVVEHDVDPREIGIPLASMADLVGGDAVANADVVRRTVAGETGPVRDIVLLNAAAALAAWRVHADPRQSDRPMRERLAETLEVAAQAIDSGAASATLERWQQAAARSRDGD
ncbi:anthranilate phosphoribosyltransferase [Agrococcus sp. SGAir0287]|uniref:anthranilate phosphoribosyltransferase n=1 Tax=Agrococcus sp. SGAir0287 TaxID=2070347 RepID=UPI0010CD3FBB|nr:anthranilate phosphoribosyltransferase [Agrococcus sp. SGAir0287]QCR19141.1 anthranilate phosphoribosyltransferase [Agrococcus sp. SGAir0287]